VNQQQPIQFTRAAADQIRETVARQRTGLRLDVQTTPPAAAHGELQTGSEDVFPVLIAKDGGADGTSSARATWVYTVNNVEGTQLGTGVAVVRARPLGKLKYGNEIASPAFGAAFYNSAGQLKLWDAGEVQDLAGQGLLFGKVTEDFTSGTTVTCTPCTATGTPIAGADDIEVCLKWDGTSVDFTEDDGGATIDAKLAEGTVLAYWIDEDGDANALTQPVCVVTKIDYSTDGIRTYHCWTVAGTQTTEGDTPVVRIGFYDVEVHQVRYNSTDKKLEVRTATVRLPDSATWSAWASILDFECLSADTINSLTGSTGGGSYT
jgi:hypothetical protein